GNSNEIPECNGGLCLEPRLHEYIKKKEAYQKMNYIPQISLEKEYRITKSDKMIIKSFLKGKRDFYHSKHKEKYLEQDDNKMIDFDEIHKKMYTEDPRYKAYLRKVARDKEIQNRRYDTSQFEFLPLTRPHNEDLKYTEQENYKMSDATYKNNVAPKLNYKNTIQQATTYPQKGMPPMPPVNHYPEIEKIIGKLDSYS